MVFKKIHFQYIELIGESSFIPLWLSCFYIPPSYFALGFSKNGKRLVIPSDYHIFTNHLLILNLVFFKKSWQRSDCHVFTHHLLFWTCFFLFRTWSKKILFLDFPFFYFILLHFSFFLYFSLFLLKIYWLIFWFWSNPYTAVMIILDMRNIFHWHRWICSRLRGKHPFLNASVLVMKSPRKLQQVGTWATCGIVLHLCQQLLNSVFRFEKLEYKHCPACLHMCLSV